MTREDVEEADGGGDEDFDANRGDGDAEYGEDVDEEDVRGMQKARGIILDMAEF